MANKIVNAARRIYTAMLDFFKVIYTQYIFVHTVVSVWYTLFFDTFLMRYSVANAHGMRSRLLCLKRHCQASWLRRGLYLT